MVSTALWNLLRSRVGPACLKPTDPSCSLQAVSATGLAASRADAANSRYDSRFDAWQHAEQLDANVLQNGHRKVIQQVLRGRADTWMPVFAASYGTDANLLFDFRARLAFVDPHAQHELRVHRELPQPAPGARAQTRAIVRDLDETLWDIGIAAGAYPLLNAPLVWWRRPLRWAQGARVERYSRIPRHCELARCLIAGPTSPSDLRRYAQVSVADLRGFIQAALMLGLATWDVADLTDTQGAT